MHAALVGYLWFAMQWHTSDVAPAVAVLWDLPAPVDTIALPAPAPPAEQATPPPPPPKEETISPPKPDIVEKVEKHPKPERLPEPPKEPPPPKKEAKPKANQQTSPQEQRRQQVQAERQHQEEMARLTSQVGVPGRAPVQASQGRLSNAYEGRIRAAVLANVHYAPPEGVEESVYAEYEVRLIPTTGELAGEPRLVHASGLPGWDEAARRAILRTDPFPLQDDGTAPRAFNLRLRPTEAR
jgi:colicin import membrane protein